MPWEFSETSKTIFTVGWRIYRSVAIKSNQFAGKKYRPSDFLKKQREQILAWHIAVKKMNNKHSQALLIFRKNPRKWNYGWSSVLKTCTALIVGVFERICCFEEVFLMALTSTEQPFIERPFYRRMITYPSSSNFCKKNSLPCYRL